MTLLEDRRSYPTAGGTVVYAPDSLGRSFRAIRTDGVPLGKFSTFEDADAVLRDQLAPEAPRPPPVARCRHCRSADHQTETCPVEAAAEQRREQRRGKRERSKGNGEQGSRGGVEGGRTGAGQGPAVRGETRRGDDPHRRVGTSEVEHGSHDDAREADLGRAVPGAGAGGRVVISRADDIPDLTADPHTLDEYAAALAFAAERTPCKAEDVRRMVWGSGKGGRDATELALGELEKAGRADRVFGGRWKARATQVPLVPGAMFSPMVSNARVTAAPENTEDELAALAANAVMVPKNITSAVDPNMVVIDSPEAAEANGMSRSAFRRMTEMAGTSVLIKPIDKVTVGDAPDGSPWVETPVEPDTGATTDVPDLLVGGIPVRWGTTEVADGSAHEVDLSGLTGTARGTTGDHDPAPETPDPAGKTPDGVITGDHEERGCRNCAHHRNTRPGVEPCRTCGAHPFVWPSWAPIAPDDPEVEVEPAEGDGAAERPVAEAFGEGFVEDCRAAFRKALGPLLAPPAPEEPVAPRLCHLPGFRWEERTVEKGTRLVRISDGWVAGFIDPMAGVCSWTITCGEMRGRGGVASGVDTASETVVMNLFRRRKDWPPVAAAAATTPPPRTIDDIAAKYAGPVYEVRRAHELVTGLPARRERLAKAIEELEVAAATGRGMLVELDRMIGGGR